MSNENADPAFPPVTPVPDRFHAGPTAYPPAVPLSQPRAAERFGVRDLFILLGLFAAAIAIRFPLIADPRLGHEPDIDLFISWTRGLVEHGLGGFYRERAFCDYPPLMLLILQGVGLATPAFGGDLALSDDLWRALKIPAGLADLLIGALLYVEARRRLGRPFAIAAASLYLLNPVTLYDSAYWGQVDSVYTAFLLFALVLAGRGWWLFAGVLSAAALGAKFQSIAILPIIVFECYRLGGWGAIGRKLVGFAIGAGLILAPFLYHGVAGEALQRSYVNVVGQYHDLSKSAYNIWYFMPDPGQADTAVPEAIVRAVSAGEPQVEIGASWLLRLRLRTISLAIFAVAVAVILAIYSLRPGPLNRYAAAGALAFAFYLFPTEMHERYAFPAIAFLALWAVVGCWQERLYFLLTCGLLLNIASRQPIEPIGMHLGGMHLAIFALLLLAMCVPLKKGTAPLMSAIVDDAAAPGGRALIPLFRGLTIAAVVGIAGLGGFVAYQVSKAPRLAGGDNEKYLSEQSAMAISQGWGQLGIDRSVSGGTLQLGDRLYLRGIGTHAPARLVYAIPSGYDEFRTTVGIDAAAAGKGSVIVEIQLDGENAFRSEVLTGAGDAVEVRIPLRGAKRLTLLCDATNDGRKSDHVSFALARFVRNSLASSAPAKPSMR